MIIDIWRTDSAIKISVELIHSIDKTPMTDTEKRALTDLQKCTLVELVESYPVLWNSALKDPSSTKDKTWTDLAEKFNLTYVTEHSWRDMKRIYQSLTIYHSKVN